MKKNNIKENPINDTDNGNNDNNFNNDSENLNEDINSKSIKIDNHFEDRKDSDINSTKDESINNGICLTDPAFDDTKNSPNNIDINKNQVTNSVNQDNISYQDDEIEFTNAKLIKRWEAFFLDLLIMILLTSLVYLLSSVVTQNVPSYKSQIELRTQLLTSTPIYDENSILITKLMDEDSSSSIIKKKEELSKCIDEFYSIEFSTKTKFFTTSQLDSINLAYKERKDESNLFIKSGDKYIEDKTKSDSDLYDFYYDEIESHSTSYLSLNSEYTSISKMVVRVSIIELILSSSLCFILTYLIVPLFIKRGRRTIGMFVCKIGMVDNQGLNVNGKKLFLRDLLVFFIGFLLSLFTLFIPFIVSISMMHLSKLHQSFFDYVTNTYIVDIKGRDIYLNYGEYIKRTGAIDKNPIENKEFKLEN